MPHRHTGRRGASETEALDLLYAIATVKGRREILATDRGEWLVEVTQRRIAAHGEFPVGQFADRRDKAVKLGYLEFKSWTRGIDRYHILPKGSFALFDKYGVIRDLRQ